MPRKKKKRIVSNGVKRIKAHLIGLKISFKEEFKIADCKNIRPLPFDFALFSDGVLVGLIEYNGIQHYQKIRRFGGKKAFERQQKHDLIKMGYCNQHNIPFLVISYLSENIEELCDEFFARIFVQN